MRMHIALEDDLVAERDRRAGVRRRSAFVAQLIRRGLEDERRRDDIESALGSVPDSGHEWDADPAMWVRRLFNGLRLAPLGAAEGMRAGSWRCSYGMRGVTLRQADCLVAAAVAGAALATATANANDFP